MFHASCPLVAASSRLVPPRADRHLRRHGGLALLAAVALVACSGEELGSTEEAFSEQEPTANAQRDLLATDLQIDLETLEAVAVVELDEAEQTGASLEVGDLEIAAVLGPEGPVHHRITDGRMDLGVPADRSAALEIRYRLHPQSGFEGLTEGGATFTWPYFCGNLFPCKSDPSDGLAWSLALTGVPAGQQAVFPTEIATDAPSYMLAWTVGEYAALDLGTTSSGTRVSVYYLPGEQAAAEQGTANLLAAFDWLEQTYGPYRFGDEVASVSVRWGPGAYGGMEHHPFWHVSADSLADEETHVHEAAHGWFGNGVRIGCWEDLTLSEGTTSYATARAIGAVVGPEAEQRLWADYERRLDQVIRYDDRIAWPDSCGEVDVLTELWNGVVYMKGAFFYRAVEGEVGREAMDGVLASFYADFGGEAATMADMLAAIRQRTGFDPTELAEGWLRQLGRPDRH